MQENHVLFKYVCVNVAIFNVRSKKSHCFVYVPSANGSCLISNPFPPQRNVKHPWGKQRAQEESFKFNLFLVAWARKAFKRLRRNPPEVRVTSGQKLCTTFIYIVWQTSVRLFWISSQKKSISTTPYDENKVWSSGWNHWKHWWNETYDGILPVFKQILWTLKFICSSFLLCVISVKYLYVTFSKGKTL